MRITQVSIMPTNASKEAGRPSLTPELLAATGARYSRSNDGLDSIVSKIDFDNPDKSVDNIFKMIDYGHQSIADMVPVAMFMDGISIYLAYYIWSICSVVGGQESSTRYIKLDPSGIIDPETLGIPENKRSEWYDYQVNAFKCYEQSLEYWTELSKKQPDLMRIPKSLLDDPSEKAQKQVERMRRNYAFDRSRMYIPVSVATNVMMVQSARAWVELSQNLLSHFLPEFNMLGEFIAKELDLVAPRLKKYARFNESTRKVLDWEFNKLISFNKSHYMLSDSEDRTEYSVPPIANLIYDDLWFNDEISLDTLKFRSNRYSPFICKFRMTPITFGWRAVSMGEIRDLNRHRTGSKYCPLYPLGFYAAIDQVPQQEDLEIIQKFEKFGGEGAISARNLLLDGDPTYMYWTLLGTQYSFMHTTTMDKFIYEAELRTGIGAHYRYAKHLHDALEELYLDFPEIKDMIFEGSAEPE